MPAFNWSENKKPNYIWLVMVAKLWKEKGK